MDEKEWNAAREWWLMDWDRRTNFITVSHEQYTVNQFEFDMLRRRVADLHADVAELRRELRGKR